MNSTIFNRIRLETEYMIDYDKTVREIAKKFNVSKSTVHKDLNERLRDLNYEKFLIVSSILKHHKDVRHIRGGESTKLKYLK